MPRVIAFSPATALTRSSIYDTRETDLEQSPDFKSQQLKWRSSRRIKTLPKSSSPTQAYNTSAFCHAGFEFDQCHLPGAFRLVQSQPLKVVSDSERPDQKWVADIHMLPLDIIASFLTIQELANVVLPTCKSWCSAFSRESVWCMMYARKSHPQTISRRSFTRSWRSLCQGGVSLSTSALLRLNPTHSYFDFTPVEPCKFSAALVNEILGHPRSPIVACLEILPGFYWTVLQTPVGFVHTGILTRNGTVVVERGIHVASRYLLSLSQVGWYSANCRSLVLLLTTLQAMPPTIAVDEAMHHPGSFLMKNPFRLVLRFPSDAAPVGYYFARPNQSRDRRLLLLPDMFTNILDLDENTSPIEQDSSATLQFCEHTNELIWSGRSMQRK